MRSVEQSAKPLFPMSYSAPPRGTATKPPNRSLGFVANAMKRKDSFIQWIAMTGILLLSVRSLGQKYRLHDLREDTYHLEQEQKSLSDRLAHVKSSLRAEAAVEPTGAFAARLRTLFGAED